MGAGQGDSQRSAGSVPPPVQLDPSLFGPDEPPVFPQEGYAPQQGYMPGGAQMPGAMPLNTGAYPQGQMPPNTGAYPQGQMPPNVGAYPQGQIPPNGGYAYPQGQMPQQRMAGQAPPVFQEQLPDDGEDDEPEASTPPQKGKWKTVKPSGKAGYHVPRTGVVSRKKRKGVPYVLFAVAVLGITAFAAIRHYAPKDAMYGYVSAGVLSSRYTGSAMVVRDETVYTQESISQIDYTAEEGTNVDRTTVICTVYTSGFNTRELTTLKRFRDQIKDYHKTLISSSGAARDARLTTLDTQVREQAKMTRQMIQESRGNLLNQEDMLTETLQSRQSYLHQKYPDDQKLSRLYDDENNQLQRISSWTKQYAAASDGIVSFYTDGYEPVLNLGTYLNFSPGEVRNMYNGYIPANPAATRNTVSIYRLIKDGRWAVLMLCDDTDWTPVTGQTYKLLIESFENTVVDATVESFTRAGGELLVRLSVNSGDVRDILYIRSCQVQLGENVDSLTVPTRALYSQMGQTGVVIVDENGNNYFTQVTVISTQGDVTHIVPRNTGVLYEGMLVKLF